MNQASWNSVLPVVWFLLQTYVKARQRPEMLHKKQQEQVSGKRKLE